MSSPPASFYNTPFVPAAPGDRHRPGPADQGGLLLPVHRYPGGRPALLQLCQFEGTLAPRVRATASSPSLSDSYNVGILIFLVILGAMVCLMNKAGGSAAFRPLGPEEHQDPGGRSAGLHRCWAASSSSTTISTASPWAASCGPSPTSTTSPGRSWPISSTPPPPRCASSPPSPPGPPPSPALPRTARA